MSEQSKTTPIWAEEDGVTQERTLQLAGMHQDDRKLTKSQQYVKAIRDELMQGNRCTTIQELRKKGLQPLGDATYAEAKIQAWRAQQPANPAFAGKPAKKRTWRILAIWGVAVIGTLLIVTALGIFHRPDWFMGLFPLIIIGVFFFIGVCSKISKLAEEEWLAIYEDIESGDHLETIPEAVLECMHKLTQELVHGKTFTMQHVFLRQYHNWQNVKEHTDHPELGGLILLNERQAQDTGRVVVTTAVLAQW